MKKITFLYLLIIFSGCSHYRGEKYCNEYIINTDKGEMLAEYIDSVEYIALDADAKIFNIDKMLVSNDTIYLLDYFKTKSLKAFDMDGKLLYQIGNRGRGHGEYLEIRNFTVDDKYIYAIDNFVKRLYIYLKIDGSYISYKQLPIVADDIAPLSDNRFLLFIPKPIAGTKLDINQSTSQAFIVDSELNIIDEFMEYDEFTYNKTSQFSALSQTDDAILITPIASNSLYVMPKKSVGVEDISKYEFVIDNEVVSQKAINDINLMERKYIMPPIYMNRDKFVATAYIPQSVPRAFMFCTSDSVAYFNQDIDSSNSLFAVNYVLPVSYVYNGCVFSILSSYEMYESLVKYGFTTTSQKNEEFLIQGNIIILKYLLKPDIDETD